MRTRKKTDGGISMKFTKIRTRLIDCSRASAEEIRHEKIVFPRKERKKSFEVPHLYCTSHLAHEYENRGRFSRPARKLKFYAYP